MFSPPSAIIDLRVKYPGQHRENRTTVTGLAIIHLPPGCQALCDKFIFTAPNDIPVLTERVTAGKISFQPFFDPFTNLTANLTAFTNTLRMQDRPLTLPAFHALHPKPTHCSSTLPIAAVSYTHLRAHETEADLVCRLLLEKKK